MLKHGNVDAFTSKHEKSTQNKHNAQHILPRMHDVTPASKACRCLGFFHFVTIEKGKSTKSCCKEGKSRHTIQPTRHYSGSYFQGFADLEKDSMGSDDRFWAIRIPKKAQLSSQGGPANKTAVQNLTGFVSIQITHLAS